MNPNITILINTVSSSTGGVASVLELAETLNTKKYDLHLGVLAYDINFQSKLQIYLKRPKAIDSQNIHYIPGFFHSAAKNMAARNVIRAIINTSLKYFRNPQKKLLREIIELCYSKFRISDYREFTTILSDANVVLEAADLISSNELSCLKKLSSASIVLNHAGSPKAFEEYWLQPQHAPSPYNLDESLYVNYCLGYDKLLFQSSDHADQCSERHSKLKLKTIVLSPTCDEKAIEKARNEPSPYSPEKLIIVNVGSIQPRKAQHLSIKAFDNIIDKFPNAELHFVGGVNIDKEYYSQLVTLIDNKGLNDSVFFEGHRSDYLRFLIHANIMLQSSSAEGVSRVLREAMYLELPIVSFAIPGTRNILTHRKEALLAQEGNSEELAELLGTCLEDSKLTLSLASAAKNRYNKVHSNKVYQNEVKRIFDNLTGVRNR